MGRSCCLKISVAAAGKYVGIRVSPIPSALAARNAKSFYMSAVLK